MTPDNSFKPKPLRGAALNPGVRPLVRKFAPFQASGCLVFVASIQGFVGESGRCVACRLPIDPQGRNVFPSVSRKEPWI
jgi:hypothetical protein